MSVDAPDAVIAVFRGHTVRISTIYRPRTASSEDNTGWCVWPASAVLLRLLADGRALARVLGCSAPVDDANFARLRVLELSAGAGLVAAAAAAAGARVIATETETQLPQLRANAEPHGAICERLLWGDAGAEAKALAALGGSGGGGGGGLPLVLACDLVFIALRDGREAALDSTLRRLASSAKVLLIYEERRIADENAFVAGLGRPASDGAAALCVEELSDGPFAACLDLPKDERIIGGGGAGEGELGALFYSPPPVRMVLLSAAAAM